MCPYNFQMFVVYYYIKIYQSDNTGEILLEYQYSRTQII